jgi:hypothetical protein
MKLAVLATLTAAMSTARAQDDPNRQWVYCHGPQTAGRLGPPPVLYVSGVSIVTDQSDVMIKAAFQDYIPETYGADFEPRCDWSSSEAAARDGVKYFTSGANGGPRKARIATGWVWTPPASVTAPPQPRQPRPGELPH